MDAITYSCPNQSYGDELFTEVWFVIHAEAYN